MKSIKPRQQKSCILLGGNSEIGLHLATFLKHDRWDVFRWQRGQMHYFRVKGEQPCWDLALIPIGTVAPVGLWHDVDDWGGGVNVNLIRPVTILNAFWESRAPGASVCFFAGANPNATMPGYSSYAAGKMGLLKACEWMDAETPNVKFFALAPGIVHTKIHKPTVAARWNNEKLQASYRENRQTPYQKIYDCLQWCVRQPKSVVGGRNICVSDSDDWANETALAKELEADTSLFKLRRQERRRAA